MHKCLTLSNFRGFKDFSMELKPITLIAGKNSTGKTSVLESVFLLYYGFGLPTVFSDLLTIRRIILKEYSAQNLWEPLFHGFDANIPLKLAIDDALAIEFQKNDNFAQARNVSEDTINSFGSLRLSYFLGCKYTQNNIAVECDYYIDIGKDGRQGIASIGRGEKSTNTIQSSLHHNYIGPNVSFSETNLTEWFTEAALNNKKEFIIEALQILDDSITDVESFHVHGSPQIFITRSGIKMPTNVMGDGIRKILQVALFLLSDIKKPLLLDEAENGLHYTLHSKFWEMMSTLAIKEGRQIIATTHSYECIEGALEGVKEAGLEDSFAYVRLDKSDDGRIVSKIYDGDILKHALDMDWEVR